MFVFRITREHYIFFLLSDLIPFCRSDVFKSLVDIFNIEGRRMHLPLPHHTLQILQMANSTVMGCAGFLGATKYSNTVPKNILCCVMIKDFPYTVMK